MIEVINQCIIDHSIVFFFKYYGNVNLFSDSILVNSYNEHFEIRDILYVPMTTVHNTVGAARIYIGADVFDRPPLERFLYVR